MKPETTESSLNTNNTQAPSLEPTAPPEPSTPTTTQAPSLQPTAPPKPSTPATPQAPSLDLPAPPEPSRAPSWGNTGNAAKYGPIDRAAESCTDRELTECLRRNLD